jgi:uncharacterized protein with FMN-binding domain
MRRVVLWLLSTLTIVVLLFGYHTSTEGVAATTSTQEPVGGSLPGGSTTTSVGSKRTGRPSPTSSPTGSPSSSQTSGPSSDPSTGSGTATTTTVTGDVDETEWGPVQVQLRTKGAAITDVEVLQYPSGNGRDLEINNYALPRLISETLQAQSADIDMVSGATVTSGGYLHSLQSALDKAGA